MSLRPGEACSGTGSDGVAIAEDVVQKWVCYGAEKPLHLQRRARRLLSIIVQSIFVLCSSLGQVPSGQDYAEGEKPKTSPRAPRRRRSPLERAIDRQRNRLRDSPKVTREDERRPRLSYGSGPDSDHSSHTRCRGER